MQRYDAEQEIGMTKRGIYPCLPRGKWRQYKFQLPPRPTNMDVFGDIAGGSPYKPSLFELVAQEQLRDLLQPALKYVLTVRPAARLPSSITASLSSERRALAPRFSHDGIPGTCLDL
jgi:hypothetical protein